MGRSRSEQMSRIRGKDTSPEKALRRALWAAGLRYRVNYRTPGGRADIALVGARVAVFVDGCFWHGCPLHYVRPRTRTEFWSAKLDDNVRRDRRQTRELELAGWRVQRLWEHEVFESAEAAGEAIRRASSEKSPPALAWRVVKADAIEGQDPLERWTLQDLRDAAQEQVIDRIRTTAKWKRPSD